MGIYFILYLRLSFADWFFVRLADLFILLEDIPFFFGILAESVLVELAEVTTFFH